MKKWKMVAYWKDENRPIISANIVGMDVQDNTVICGTVDGGTIIINIKLIAYIQTYPLKDGK